MDFEPDAEDALDLAVALELPIYDCIFLATAVRENTVVVTDDTRFAAAVRKHGRWAPRLTLLSET